MPKQKKNFNPKKPQLRRCAFCDKSGHNKSTCSDYLKSFVKVNSSPATIAPINFFPPELAPKKQKYSNQSSWTFTKFFELGAQKINLAFKKATNAVAIFLRENFVFRKLAVSTAILMIILVAPGSANSYYQNIILTKDKIAQDSTAGFLSLQNSTVALMQADLPTAELAIDNAMTNFSSAVETMQNNHQFLQKVASFVPVLDTEVRSRQSLLLAGQKIAQGNTYFLKGIAQSQNDASNTPKVRLENFYNYIKLTNYK